MNRTFVGVLLCSSVLVSAAGTRAQDAMGAPPPDATAAVSAPKDVPVEPKIEKKDEGTAITVSAGGQLAAGNSKAGSLTANGAFDKRWDDNGIGASLLGNYVRSGQPNERLRTTAENVQGRVRYDRYVLPNASVFLLNTLRHDRFQGLDLRYNLDPGFKYLALKEDATTLGLEAGYDFQYDVRRDSARVILDDMKMPTGEVLAKHATDHSLRAYAGFKHAFNPEVTFSTGLEYLQSVVHSTKWRLNYDVLFAAKVVGGLALGVGATVRYDHAPLPSKKRTDLATTLSIIYSYSDQVAAAPPPPPAPCPEPPPLPAPAAAPPIPMEAAPAAPAPTEAAPAAPSETPNATGPNTAEPPPALPASNP